jgi:hypothetical protein
MCQKFPNYALKNQKLCATKTNIMCKLCNSFIRDVNEARNVEAEARGIEAEANRPRPRRVEAKAEARGQIHKISNSYDKLMPNCDVMSV